MINEKDCLFCKIVKGQIPSMKIYEDTDCIAILDINPASKGHTLVIPKKHSLNIFDTDEEVLKKVIAVAKRLSENIKNKLNADGINILQNNGQQAGQIVQHFHLHIIPRYKNDRIVFMFPRATAKKEELESIAKLLSGEKEEKIEDEFF